MATVGEARTPQEVDEATLREGLASLAGQWAGESDPQARELLAASADQLLDELNRRKTGER